MDGAGGGLLRFCRGEGGASAPFCLTPKDRLQANYQSGLTVRHMSGHPGLNVASGGAADSIWRFTSQISTSETREAPEFIKRQRVNGKGTDAEKEANRQAPRNGDGPKLVQALAALQQGASQNPA